MTEVLIHPDGACRGNPGPGGWGVLMQYGAESRELSGAEPITTNNRMEVLAAIQALEALHRPCRVKLVTDSKYLMDGTTSWMANWKKNGWKTAARKPVKNEDLWRRLDKAVQVHEIHWQWVKGHSGHPGNERADALANRAIDAMLGKKN